MVTVYIDIAKLRSAMDQLNNLQSDTDLQVGVVRQKSPIGLSSLSPLGPITQWLRDQRPELKTRHDIAVLLNSGATTGTASFDVAIDDLSHAEEFLGDELAERLLDVDYETEAADLEFLNTFLAGQTGNEGVMTSMFEELGPQGTAGVLMTLSGSTRNQPSEYQTNVLDLARTMRRGLATASNSAEWGATSSGSTSLATQFGSEMTRWLVAPMLSREEQEQFRERFPNTGMDGASVLAFMMREHGYDDDFLLGAAGVLDRFERGTHDGPMSADVWYAHNGMGPFNDADRGAMNADPMAEIMRNLASNPEAGMEFFDDQGRRTFYFNDRDWKQDGFESISMVAESVSTHAGNLESDPELATTIASQFIDMVANSEGFNPEDAQAASPYVAELLKFYMPAVDAALRGGENEGDGGSVPFELDYFGSFEHYPEFFRNDLAQVVQVALSTESGMTSMAEGVGVFQQTQLNNVAATLGLDPEDAGVRSELADVVTRSAALSGFMEYQVGTVEIEAAQDQDKRTQAWIDLVGDAAGLVPMPGADQVGTLVNKGVGFAYSQAVDLGKDAAGEAFTSNTGAAVASASDRAETTFNTVQVNTYVALVEAGIIPPDEVSPRFLQDGRLIDPAKIPAEQMSEYTQAARNGYNEFITSMDLETAYDNGFNEYYTSEPK